jgi:hypothetical protein
LNQTPLICGNYHASRPALGTLSKFVENIPLRHAGATPDKTDAVLHGFLIDIKVFVTVPCDIQ